MKKIRQLKIVILLLVAIVAFIGFIVMNVDVKVQAGGKVMFSMGTGVVIRTNPEESGMRWTTNVSEAWYKENVPTEAKVVFGTFVTSADNVDSVEELDENFNNEKKDIVCPSEAKFKDGVFTYYSSVIYNKVSEENQKDAYAEELVARSYAKYSIDNGATWTYVYAVAEDSLRCIRMVAATTIMDEKSFDNLTDEEKTAVQAYVGENNGNLVQDGYLETAKNDVLDVSAYGTVYENNKKISGIKTEFEVGEHYDYVCFDADGNFATARFQYVTQAFDNEIEFQKVLQTNVANTEVDGYYALANNIMLSGTWTNAMIFKGVLDGNGYTIDGLSLAKKSGLFSVVNGATIKNIIVQDATFTSGEAGVFAYETQSPTTFENVYVSVVATIGEYYAKEQQETNPIFVLDTRYGIGGLIAKSTQEITVKNSVIYMPEHLTNASGFVAGCANATINLIGCTFIGGNGKIYGEFGGNVATVVRDENTVVCDAVKAYTALYGNDFDKAKKENDNDWSDMLIKAYESNHPLMILNASNIADLTMAANHIVVLTEDINLKGAELTYFGGENYFKGVFDGQNHSIVNIDVSGKASGGLFKRLAGSVKNVALDGQISSGGGNGGLVTDYILGTTYLENVYLKPKFMYAVYGAVGRRVGTDNTSYVSLSMKDVIIVVEKFTEYYISDRYNNSNGAVLGYGVQFGYGAQSAMGVYMENCYHIAPEERPISWRKSVAQQDGLSSLDNNDKYFFWNVGDVVNGTTMTEDDGLTWYSFDKLPLFNAWVQTGKIQLSDFLKKIVQSIESTQ